MKNDQNAIIELLTERADKAEAERDALRRENDKLRRIADNENRHAAAMETERDAALKERDDWKSVADKDERTGIAVYRRQWWREMERRDAALRQHDVAMQGAHAAWGDTIREKDAALAQVEALRKPLEFPWPEAPERLMEFLALRNAALAALSSTPAPTVYTRERVERVVRNVMDGCCCCLSADAVLDALDAQPDALQREEGSGHLTVVATGTKVEPYDPDACRGPWDPSLPINLDEETP